MRATNRFGALGLVSLLLLACGGGDSTSNTPAPTPMNLTGNWHITASSTVFPGTTSDVVGSLRSTGSSITGVVHIIGSSCYDAGTNISVSGTLDNSSIQVTSASIDGQVFAFNGTAGGSGSSISGGYTITGGCAGGDSGNVSGTRIPSLSGTWSATLTSTPSSAVAHVTSASLTQSGPDAGGFFPLTGTATLLDSSCYTSASLSGWIIGRYVFIRATNSANSSEFTDVFTLVNTAGTSGTGDYEAFNGPCAGDFGTVSLSKQ